MKAKELRELSADELKQKGQDLRREHFELRKVKIAGKLENPLRLRLIRRDYARIKTILNEPTKK